MVDRQRIEPTLGGGPPPLPPALPPAAGLAFAAHDPVAIREQHIGHERRLKAVGLLFGFGAFFMLTGMAGGVYVGAVKPDPSASDIAMPLVLGAIGLLFGVLTYGYRKLRPWVKYVGTPVSCFGLLGLPFGTLLHGYILYLIWCSQGQRVLQPDYAAIIRSTPQVRYQYSLGDKLAAGILLLLVIGLVAWLLSR